MLGTEPDLIATYVDAGLVRLIFWPVLNHGSPSVYATVTMDCAGRQDVAAAWELHNRLFENQRDLWTADMDYYVDLAAGAGLDPAAFSSCYTSAEALEQVMALDQIRQDRGVFSQPVFDLNGQGLLLGNQPFDAFASAIDVLLQEQTDR